ncbi:Na+/H+ antiporter NhaC [Brevibacillus migulae]|uniref:Na+/H+ antiporter NhaC n=1 Tax=Brevibacillus migulae TaxID=1644114 RepID=UPI00106ECC48|nr:Na+/H+ antiporter NhaC [Brevibacillus migulae]
MVSQRQAIGIMIVLCAVMAAFIGGLKAAPQVPLLLCLLCFIVFGMWMKSPWERVEKALRDGITPGIPAIFIFILIGVLIAVWIASGTIPSMLVYGLQLLSSEYLLVTSFVLTLIVGSCIGSAFTTVATIGVALLGIGHIYGIPLPLLAGAVISGAFFGDKMSPLSDTTNLAASISGVDMFQHIRHMMWTTVPAMLISLLLFLLLGNQVQAQVESQQISVIVETISQVAFIHWVTLLPILVLVVLAWKKVSAVPTLLAGIVAGLLLLFFTNDTVTWSSLVGIMQDGFVAQTGVEEVDRLLSRGGIQSMMWSVSLVLLSLGLGGLLQEFGVIQRLVEPMLGVASRAKLIFSTALSAIGVNVLIGEQYLSILLPGKMFKDRYEEAGLDSVNMSRVLEDAGTVVNPLIPWGVSGVFVSGVLGVSTLEYLPYGFFCLLCPVITMVCGVTGWGILPKRAQSTDRSQKVH